MVERADAAAELHRIACRRQDRFHGRAIDAFAGKGAIQVHDMQPGESLILEGASLIGGIGIIDGRGRHIAELQPHALPVFQVDGRKKDHVTASSGGNW